MDERAAWKSFYMTGKIEDYIRYSQIKSHEMQQNAGALGMHQPIKEDGQRAGQDPGVNYPGAGYR